jgi:HEAT repeat protein
MRAAQTLGVMGELGMQPLLQALGDPHHMMHQPIMCALYWTPPTGTNAVRAVHLLIPYTQDRDSLVARTAVDALGAIAAEAEIVLPVLTTALKSNDLELRKATACSIGKFGTKARPAIPALVQVLEDLSPEVRSSATNALKAIAPQIFADADPE